MVTSTKFSTLSVYVAASYRHLHLVQLWQAGLQAMMPSLQILDWTSKAVPPAGLAPDQRRQWMDTDQPGGTVYEFCSDACRNADVVVYLGASGQDAGVEVGIAAGAGVPVIGVAGPLEAPGLMLNGAVSRWCESLPEAELLLWSMEQCFHRAECWHMCPAIDFCKFPVRALCKFPLRAEAAQAKNPPAPHR